MTKSEPSDEELAEMEELKKLMEADEPKTSKRDDAGASQWVKDVHAGLYDPEPEDLDKNT
jgi:hypothetical protein